MRKMVYDVLADIKDEYRMKIANIIRMCEYCHVTEANVLLLPCGHLKGCMDCRDMLKQCSACGREVRGTIRVHFTRLV